MAETLLQIGNDKDEFTIEEPFANVNDSLQNESSTDRNAAVAVASVVSAATVAAAAPAFSSNNNVTNRKIKPLTGSEANTYRIIGIVNHLGVSSNSGHYISDVYNRNTNNWSSYDDTKVESLTQDQVLRKRTNTGYIFFYINT